jgi:hypothetical protein
VTATLLRPANALGSISVIDPATPLKRREASQKRGLAPRSASLDGKVLAIVDNQMGSAPILAEALLARLKETYRLADVIWVKKPSVSVPPRPEDWAKVTSSADAGLALFGGCGSCTSRAVRDAIEMEWSGIQRDPQDERDGRLPGGHGGLSGGTDVGVDRRAAGHGR